MDLLEDPAFKIKYQKSKFRVKRWESEFMEKYGRKPNKNDIRAADNTIKESYKMYWRLKTQALEETLLDITFSDDIQSNVSANTSANVSFSAETIDSNPIDKSLSHANQSKSLESPARNMENIDPEKPEKPLMLKAIVASSVAKEESPNVDGAWGEHLNKEKTEIEAPKNKKSLIIGRSSSFQLSQKMFSASSLTKRNPRKSLSMNKLKKSEQNLGGSVAGSGDKPDGFDVDPTKPLFGDVRVIHAETKVSVQPINAIQELIKGGSPMINRKLNQGWLDRCSRENGLEPISGNPKRLSGTSDSGVESMDTSDPSLPQEIPRVPSPREIPVVSSDDDFVCNSDSEEERRNKRVRNFKKRLSDGVCQQEAKRQRIDSEDLQFSYSQPLPNKITIGLTSPILRDSIPPEIRSQGDEKTRNVEEAEKKIAETETRFSATVQENKQREVGIKPGTANNPEIEEKEKTEPDANEQNSGQKKSARKPRVLRGFEAGLNNETEANAEIIEQQQQQQQKKKKIARKPRVTKARKKSDADFQEDGEEDNDPDSSEEYKPARKTRAKTTRTTRAARGAAKPVDAAETGRKKARAPTARKGIPRKRVTKVAEPTDEEEELAEENAEGGKIPIYGVEAGQVVPRFALSSSASGDLVSDFSRSIAPRVGGTNEASSSSRAKGPLTAREKLEQKMAAGKMNENFVRVNLKKKVFVRGKKNFNFSKYRKNQWKQRKKELSSGEAGLDLADFAEKSGGACFKCGATGHFAQRCTATKSDDLLPDDGVQVSEFPTLEEAEKMATRSRILAHSTRMDRLPSCPSYSKSKIAKAEDEAEEKGEKEDEDYEDFDGLFEDEFHDENVQDQSESAPRKLQGHKIPEELLAKLLPPENGVVDPVFGHPLENLPETPAEVFEALRMFGHEKFRPGQEKAVMRILSGQSTLVTLSTGSGKSLCYQLPAFIYAKQSRCITLVVSPLVSLMDDQVVGVPKFLSAAALHTGQSASVKAKIMETIKAGKLDILLVSPEAVVAGEKSTGFGSLLRQLPPIAFACIDEAHCISQWSHNFRPSYLMICRVLIEKLGVKTILGLTATATKSTAESIVNHLNIRDGLAGVISDTPMPRNLTLTVSKDEQRDRALIDLLMSERFRECDSIIVYCTRREECTRIAGVIRVSLQDPRNPENPKAKCSSLAEAYHAGLTASRRKIIQKSFMSGETRVVVATVAFGMGINKANIRSVIHYNMPASFEGYVQEVGRAGRDNLPAHCHLFLAPSKDGDKLELRRHIFADGVDRHMIRRLLQKVFVPCSCPRAGSRSGGQRCPGHEVAIPVDETVRALDISEETIATLLCYLELHPRRYVTVLSSVYVNAKVSSYGGPRALRAAAQTSPPLAMAIALDLKKGISHDDSSMVEFPVVDVAAAIGWDSGVVKNHLKNLEWQIVDGKSKRSAISVRYDTLGLRVRAPGDLTDAELDEALEALAGRARDQESSALRQLDAIHAALSKYSVPSVRQCVQLSEDISLKSESLKEIIREYFRSDEPLTVVEIPPQANPTNEAEIMGDVRALISSYRDNNFTGRAVARIFHGIQSPNYSALVWSRCRFWRAHLATDFNFICRIATREILAMR